MYEVRRERVGKEREGREREKMKCHKIFGDRKR
jgi:hypothetical protein